MSILFYALVLFVWLLIIWIAPWPIGFIAIVLFVILAMGLLVGLAMASLYNLFMLYWIPRLDAYKRREDWEEYEDEIWTRAQFKLGFFYRGV